MSKEQQTQLMGNNAASFELGQAISYIFRHYGVAVDATRLNDGLSHCSTQADQIQDVVKVLQAFTLPEPEILSEPDPAFFPLLAYQHGVGWGVITERQADGRYVFKRSTQSSLLDAHVFSSLLNLSLNSVTAAENQTFSAILFKKLRSYRSVVGEAIIATIIINILALAVSLFSMQVYDRVIPTRSEYTLIILSSGVALVILLELILKFARSKVMDRLVIGIDQHLSREVFQRLLKVRMDQMPGSVGSMAAQLRGYEQVRSFYTASTLFSMVDLPMALVFIVLIAVIGSPWVALVPLILAFLAITLGLVYRKKTDEIAAEGAQASYRKTGILVEAVEGMETIKAGAGGYKFLSRWLDVMQTTVYNDLKMRKVNEHLNYLIQMLQQFSYIGIVIVGAYVVMSGDMTMGALIACSILGGRVLAPILQVPNLLIQHSHAKAAKANVESLFELQQDNHGVQQPLVPSRIYGQYVIENMTFHYQGNEQSAISIPQLQIQPGERIAILGAIGSGKSTLLKVLSGLYAPTKGRVLLDGLDMNQISYEVLNHQLGYLQQDHRLFQGTLRENLLIGLPHPEDDAMRHMLQRTGLIRLVNSHSSGLDLPISEGGRGLSGGQKQLVAFSRLILTRPNVLLLDEPTSSMDNIQEQQCLKVLAEELQRGQTLIVSTHKTSILGLVNRIIVMDHGKVVLDGPKQAVLDYLKNNEIKQKTVFQAPTAAVKQGDPQ
ncbi:TPA: type I secretion system permease/ATPase [Acinetobacter baumannii]|nr:type I secretion system permease/ATPase [Acinetobacter baumannii]